MAFDIEAARKAGYSDAEIVDHLAKERNFDAAAARKSGYKDEEILGTLAEPAAPKPEQSVGGYLRGAKRAIEGGLSFGFRDEAAATIDGAVNSAVTGAANLFRGQAPNFGETYSRTYDESLGRERAETADFAEQNPGTAIAGNLVGGVLVPGSMGAGVVRGAGAGSAALRGTIAGGAGGGVAGFGDGEGGFVERATNAGQGFALGAAGGAAIGAGANLAARYGGRILDVGGFRNADVGADRQILRAISRDRMSLDEVAAAAAKPQGGAPLALADLAGRNTTQLAVTAANVPGEAAQVADRFTQARRLAGPDRMATIADDVFGGGGGDDVAAQMEALGRRRSADAAPLYRRAEQIELQPDEFARVERFMADPIGQDALQQGLRVIELEHLAKGETFDPALYGVTRGEGGKFVRTEEATPNMRLMDAVKRGYDEIVEGFRDKTSGRLNLNQYGKAVDNVRRTYRDELAGMFHPYRKALEAWSGPSQSMDAVNRGRQAFRVDRDVVDSAATRLGPGDQDFYRLGAGRAFTDMASDPKNVRATAAKLLEDRQMQARLRSLLPPDKQAALAEALQGEVRVQAGNAAYSPRAGSPTSRNQASMDDMEIDPPGGMVMGLLENYQRNGVSGIIGQGAKSLYRRGQGINSSTADALAKRLFEADPVRNAAIVKALTERQGKDALTAAQRGALAERLMQGLGVAGGMQVTD